jgi:hypothetical protein
LSELKVDLLLLSGGTLLQGSPPLLKIAEFHVASKSLRNTTGLGLFSAQRKGRPGSGRHVCSGLNLCYAARAATFAGR